MSDHYPSNKSQQLNISDFLEQVAKSPIIAKGKQKGRIIFAMDATASRESMWDMASQMHADMFNAVADIGGISIQLCFYRGFNEFRYFDWSNKPKSMQNAISSVHCLAGQTQISKILKHTLNETQQVPVQALVFIGDSMEENVDKLGNLAGQLGIYKTPAFFFQEGNNPIVKRAYQQFSQLSGGAHCSFDAASAHMLADLLKTVARYSVGGLQALQSPSNQSEAVKMLTQQLRGK
jgi:hypothetical protein